MAEFRPSKAQEQAIRESGKNILVSAGAGSGKTTVLVERVLRMILEEKIDIDSLIIVTFTRAAAAHMKEKIHGRIRTAMEDDTLSEDVREHLKGQLLKVFGAKICTLDSLCMDIVRENFQSVDIDPAFRIADEAETALLMQDVLTEMIEDHYKEPTEEFIDFVNYYTDKNDAKLEDIILTLYRFSQSHPDPEEWLLRSALPYARADLFGNTGDEELAWLYAFGGYLENEIDILKNRAERGIALCEIDGGPAPYAANFEQVLEGICSLSGQSFDNRRWILKDILSSWKRLPASRKDEVSLELKSAAQDLYKELKAGLKTLSDQYFYQSLEENFSDMKACAHVAETVLSLTREYSRRLSEEKKARMIADFNDVAHFALRVLVQKKEDGTTVFTPAADSIAHAAKEIIVDEYQDTNRLQDALLYALSSERFGKPNIFMVGDVKQSIYAFRLACPDLFIEKYHAYDGPDENGIRIILGDNYRSRREIVDFINLVFEKIMLPEVGGIDYTDGNYMTAGAQYPELKDDPSEYIPEVLFVEGSGDSGKDAESYEIARKIEELIKSHYVTGEDGILRKIRYSDIAILTRTANNPRLEKMLTDRHIPVQKSSSKGFFAAFEVRLAIDLMKVVDNPLQDIPLAAVLISPLTGLKADALARIKTAGNKEPFCLYEACLSYMESHEDGLKTVLQDFFDRLRIWREKSVNLGICRFLDELLEESHLSDCVRAMTYGQGRAANMEFLKKLAESYAKGSYTGLFHFIRYLDAVQKAEKDFGSGKSSVSEDSVAMMTIHKSKGLEFPVVILADAGKQITDKESSSPVYLDDVFGIGIELRDLDSRIRKRTMLMETIAMKRKISLIAEEIRLLYVAMSRAKEKLIITGAKGNLSSRRKEWTGETPVFLPDAGTVRHDNSYMFLLADAMKCAGPEQKETFRWTVSDMEEAEIERAFEIFGEQECRLKIEEKIRNSKEIPPDEKIHAAEKAGIYVYEYPYLNATKTGVKVTASQLEQYETDRELSEEKISAFRFRKTEGLSGAERGNAYHKLFERLDYGAEEKISTDPEGFIGEQIEGLISSGHLSKEEAEAIEPDKIARFLRSGIGVRMRSAFLKGTLKREQQFVMSAMIDGNPEGLLQGIIDAFFVEEKDGRKEIILVDYKTNRNYSEQDFIETYRPQQEQYAKALERATGLPVAEKILYAVEDGLEIRL